MEFFELWWIFMSLDHNGKCELFAGRAITNFEASFSVLFVETFHGVLNEGVNVEIRKNLLQIRNVFSINLLFANTLKDILRVCQRCTYVRTWIRAVGQIFSFPLRRLMKNRLNRLVLSSAYLFHTRKLVPNLFLLVMSIIILVYLILILGHVRLWSDWNILLDRITWSHGLEGSHILVLLTEIIDSIFLSRC